MSSNGYPIWTSIIVVLVALATANAESVQYRITDREVQPAALTRDWFAQPDDGNSAIRMVPEPDDGVDRQSFDAGGFRARWGRGQKSYVIRGRSGAGYYSVPGESLWGMTYGFDTALNVSGNWNLLGSVNVNHITGGSQLVGTLGLLKVSDFSDCQPWSFSFLYDQFTDSRIDGLYITQGRTQLGYALSNQQELGVAYSFPLNKDTNVPANFNFFGTNFPQIATAQMSESITMYLAGQRCDTRWALLFGYRDDPDSGYFGASLQRDLSDQLSTYANLSTSWRVKSWSGGIGVQLKLGGRRRHRGAEVCEAYDPISGNDVQLVNYVPGAEGGPTETELQLFGGAVPTGTAVNRAEEALDSSHWLVGSVLGDPSWINTFYSAVIENNAFLQQRFNIFNVPGFVIEVGRRFANATQD